MREKNLDPKDYYSGLDEEMVMREILESPQHELRSDMLRLLLLLLFL